ncbi:hypothetical protein JT306_15790 [Salmonella enterica subsp. enterica serovar Kentucky]|nr:hypothetical protein [Salmonella enterica subsp. enterica serovar Kentucky]
MMAAARLTMSVLLLNIPSGGVMMLSGLLPGGRWFAQLCVLHLTVIGAVLYLLIIPFLSKITLSVV